LLAVIIILPLHITSTLMGAVDPGLSDEALNTLAGEENSNINVDVFNS